MSDDRTKRGPQDRARINLREPYEVEYWTRQLGVREQALVEAVDQVGVAVSKVRAYLRRQREKSARAKSK